MSAKIAAALHEVMAKVGYVQKTGENKFHGYRYAGEADLLASLRPAMVEAGLLLIPSAEEVSPPDAHGNVTVRLGYTLAHKDGDVWPTTVYAVGTGNDMSPKTGRIGDKGIYKAITGANKYLLFKLFQIETGDDPEVTAAHETETAPKTRKKMPEPEETEEPQSAYWNKQKKPEAWATVAAMFRSAKSSEELNDVGLDPEYKRLTKHWPNYWLLLMSTEEYLPKLEEFEGAEKARQIEAKIRHRLPVDELEPV